MNAHTLPLFEPVPADQLVGRLQACFQSWLDSAPARGPRGSGRLREESARIYADMWQAFIAFCAPLSTDAGSGESGQRVIRLDPLRPPDAKGQETLDRRALLDFLEHEAIRPLRQVRTRRTRTELTPRYAWRLLQLIDRVLNHTREQEDQPAYEPALALMQEPPFCHANAAALTPVPDVLTDAQCESLIAHCTEFQSLDPAAGAAWKVLRDRCALALMLGAGLAPGQVRALRLRDVSCDGGREPDLPWRLTIVADGSSPEHQVPLADWAARQLRLWLAARRMLGAEMQCAEWVFPSTLSGKPWSHPACHRAAVTQLDALGIEGGAPFRLRHTFAVRQLQAGHAEEDVARWMGYVDTGPMKRYRHLLTAPVAGLA